MASAEFDEASEDKRPAVQVGDPFTEKTSARSLPRTDGHRCGDLDPGHGGPPGLTCSAVEMGDKGRSRRQTEFLMPCRSAKTP